MKITKRYIILSTIIAFFATSVFMNVRLYNEQKGIAEKIVRFHVRANSDSEFDQNVKLYVRDAVLDYTGEILKNSSSKEESIDLLNENIDGITKTAQNAVYEKNSNYEVRTNIKEEYFPVRDYGDFVFPAGRYTSFVIEIGSGKGANWWCVMYPQLCFVDEAVVTDDEKTNSELKNILTKEEYNLITKDDDIKVKFKIGEAIGKIF